MKDIEREIELIDYIEVVLKRKWLIAAATLAGLAGGWFFRADPPPTRYEAAVMLMVKPMASTAVGTEVAVPSLSSQFYHSLALADDLKQALIDSLGLGGRISSLDGVLQVENVDQTGIRLKVKSTDAALAIELVNAWAEIFLVRNQGLSSDEVESFFDYVSSQYDRSRRLLESAEDSLQFFEATNQVVELEEQRSMLGRARNALQDSLIIFQVEEQAHRAELHNAEERLASIEFNGKSLSFSNISVLTDSSDWPSSAAARSVIANMLKLDSHEQSLQELDERHGLKLVEFNQTHGYEKLEQQISDLDSLVRLYRSDLLQSESGNLYLQREIQEVERTLQTRSPTLRLGNDNSTPNPAYVEIAQKLDSLKADQQTTASRHKSSVANDLRQAESNLIRLRKLYYPLRRVREGFVEQFNRERKDLVRQIRSLRNAYEVSASGQSNSRRKVASLRPLLQNLQARISGKNRALTQVRSSLKEVEGQLSSLLSRRDRLNRSQQTYQGTFDRFSKLLEETRIAREKAAGDIQILSRAIEARVVPQESPKQKAAISGAVALIVSTFLVFLLEYVRKARLTRAASEP